MAWDIFMQDFRFISAESCDLLTTLPGDDTFWEYFNENVLTMQLEEKTNFMNT